MTEHRGNVRLYNATAADYTPNKSPAVTDSMHNSFASIPMREKKLGNGSRIPERLPSRKAIRIFLTIRQGILIVFALLGMVMLIFVCWLMVFGDPSDVDFGEGNLPSWILRLAAIGFVLFWNILVHMFLIGNNKRLKQVKNESNQQNGDGDGCRDNA